MYAVEAKNIDAVVRAFGPSTKMGAIVGGQTSTKAPEIAAFEKHLPSDVEIAMAPPSLRWRGGEREDQPYAPHLQQQMARLRRPRHPQSQRQRADQTVREERD